MTLRGGRIWKGDQVHSNMADNALLVEYLSNRLGNGHHVHVRQRLLGEETAGVNVVSGCKTVDGANQLYVAIWLDKEADGGRTHLVSHTCGSSFDDSTYFAEGLKEVIPSVAIQLTNCYLHSLC